VVIFLQEQFGISAEVVAAPAAAAAADLGAGAPAAAEVKEFFTVKIGPMDSILKITVLKVIRTLTGMGLKEAKEIVDKAVKEKAVVKENVKKDEAEAMKTALKEAGTPVELA
jgi:large subunit ribosomal protein L7/L12